MGLKNHKTFIKHLCNELRKHKREALGLITLNVKLQVLSRMLMFILFLSSPLIKSVLSSENLKR